MVSSKAWVQRSFIIYVLSSRQVPYLLTVVHAIVTIQWQTNIHSHQTSQNSTSKIIHVAIQYRTFLLHSYAEFLKIYS